MSFSFKVLVIHYHTYLHCYIFVLGRAVQCSFIRIDESLKGLLDCFVHVDCSNKIRCYNLKIDKKWKNNSRFGVILN